MDELRALQSLGLELPSAAYIVGAIVFGLIGLAAFRHGRKHKRRVTLWLGVALMLYPYAISQTWLLTDGYIGSTRARRVLDVSARQRPLLAKANKPTGPMD